MNAIMKTMLVLSMGALLLAGTLSRTNACT